MITDDDETPPIGTQLDSRCTVTCDKGSRCVKPKHGDQHHETEHGCICYGCATWDATSGMRCIVYGCTHEASPALVCPCHEVTE